VYGAVARVLKDVLVPGKRETDAASFEQRDERLQHAVRAVLLGAGAVDGMV
jgi:hypothetical protein